jgi:hypothetical protein
VIKKKYFSTNRKKGKRNGTYDYLSTFANILVTPNRPLRIQIWLHTKKSEIILIFGPQPQLRSNRGENGEYQQPLQGRQWRGAEGATPPTDFVSFVRIENARSPFVLTGFLTQCNVLTNSYSRT